LILKSAGSSSPVITAIIPPPQRLGRSAKKSVVMCACGCYIEDSDTVPCTCKRNCGASLRTVCATKWRTCERYRPLRKPFSYEQDIGKNVGGKRYALQALIVRVCFLWVLLYAQTKWLGNLSL
jgi:hypothetical protein